MDVLYLPTSSKGYKYGLIISDLYSLYISFFPMKTKGSAEVARNLRSYFSAHCPPKTVYSDNDPCFRGDVETLFRLYRVQHLTSYPFTQRQNYVESQVRIFKNAYRAAILDNPVFKTRDWDTLYPLVVCRINCMISKYGMSREAMHYGNIVESSLPLITDSEVYEPLEADLDRAATMFRNRMGRFMEKRRRNKLYYKIGKEHKFYINELVMYKVYTPASMLHPTYTGPARIVDLGPKGATLRDPKTGTTFSVSFENLRKINFDELCSLLPQNFDAEIADTLGTYRYRRAAADPSVSQIPEPPDSEPDPSDDDPNPEQSVEESKSEENPDVEEPTLRRTRSGKVFNVKPEKIPAKIRDQVKRSTLRMIVVPKVVNGADALPPTPCLKRRYENKPFRFLDPDQIWDPGVPDTCGKLADKTLQKIASYKDQVSKSSFTSEKKCTQDFTLKSTPCPRRVKFGTITVYFI